jgi:uncharacterized repeat protein (TIGR03806 family)
MNHSRLITLVVLVSAVACGKPEPSPDASVDDTGVDMGSDLADGSGDTASDMPTFPECEPRFLGPGDEPFETLSEYCLFGGRPAEHVPGPGVIPFDPISVLYADRSLKERFVVVPDGETITFDESERWTYPDGTILVKTFYFWNDATDHSKGRRLLETRLIVKNEGAWEPYIYIWDPEQTDAVFDRVGDWIDLERVDESGETVMTTYRVPNKNQCKSCHEQSDAVVPLGPRTFQLNREYDYGGEVGVKNQLQHWADEGLFDEPPADPSSLFALTDYTDESADLDDRARSYLEVNCAHCHNPDGAADPSGLKLSVTITEPHEYGVCRTPVAAGGGSGGYFYDIVPGEPDESILMFRMSSTDPDVKMPELPTQTADDFGVDLMREWIAAMEPAGCPDP